MDKVDTDDRKDEEWYKNLSEKGKYIFNLIIKYHKYFSYQDKKYRYIVRLFKILVLFLAMLSTIILGLKNVIDVDQQIIIGLIISAFISFITAVLSYFNFEEYWMRNITTHIELNILRDNFIFDAKSHKLTCEQINHYKNELDNLQHKNIKYWKKAIKRV